LETQPTSNGGSIFHSTIFGAMPFILLFLAKGPIENESEGGNRESIGVKGMTTIMSLHFPFLNLLFFHQFIGSDPFQTKHQVEEGYSEVV